MKQVLSKILVSIVALLTLNCSIEVAHPTSAKNWNGEDFVEDLTYNDIESIYELVTECWMDVEDHVPETNDDDSDELKPVKDNSWLVNYVSPLNSLELTDISKQHGYYIDNYASVYLDRYSPPPNYSC